MGESLPGVAVAWWLLALAGADHRTLRLPNRWVMPAVVAVAASSIGTPQVLLAAVLAAAPYVVGVRVGQCGGGDAKVAFVLGGLASDPGLALTTVLAAQVLTVTAAVRSPTAAPRAHGPALTSAATITVVG